MNVHVLVLDDELPSLRDPLQEALSAFLEDRQIPALEGGSKVITLTGLWNQPVQLTITCNASTTFGQVLREIQEGFLDSDFDLILLDDQWGGGQGEFAGQEVLLEPLFSNTQGNGSEPVIALWTQEWEEEVRTEKFTRLLRQPPFWGSTRVRGLSKSNTAGLRLLFQEVIGSRQLKNENKALKKQNELATELAHSDLDLLQHTRHLIGIDRVILAVAEAVQPYFDWLAETKDKTHEEFAPERRRGQYIAGLLFEGEPASGKSALCNAIAAAFGSKATPLPKTLGPAKHSRDWEKQLELAIRPVYLEAANKKQVVVIRADDLMWPALSGEDSSVAADWREYMLVLRDLIRDATFINKGVVPTHTSWLSKVKYEGKILWLLARNTEVDAGEMSAPLRSLLDPVELKFPVELDDRKRILKMRAERENYEFADGALAKAARELLSYNGRDLIGDDEGPRGFLLFAVQQVYRRERNILQDKTKANWTITEDIVHEWLQSPMHEAIMKSVQRRREQLAEPTFAAPRPKVQHYADREERVAPISRPELDLEKQRQLLLEIEKALAAPKPNKEQIARELLGSRGDGRQAFTNFFKTHGPGQVFHTISQTEAEANFSHILKFLASNQAIHNRNPNLYPAYVQNYRRN